MRTIPRASRPLLGLVFGTVGILAITALLYPFSEDLNRVAPALFLIIPVLLAGLVGGRLVAVVVALEATLALAMGFLPPLGWPPAVHEHQDRIIAISFVMVAISGGIIVATSVFAERARSTALQRLDLDRSALLRSVSHDLRTPLATIHAAATGLQSEVPFDEETREELFDLVIDETERLDRLVRNLLSLSRIEAGAFLPDLQSVDLGELIDTCMTRMQRLFRGVEIVLVRPPGLVLVQADYSQIDQVISNLLENAARHSPIGGLVEVAYGGDERSFRSRPRPRARRAHLGERADIRALLH